MLITRCAPVGVVCIFPIVRRRRWQSTALRWADCLRSPPLRTAIPPALINCAIDSELDNKLSLSRIHVFPNAFGSKVFIRVSIRKFLFENLDSFALRLSGFLSQLRRQRRWPRKIDIHLHSVTTRKRRLLNYYSWLLCYWLLLTAPNESLRLQRVLDRESY